MRKTRIKLKHPREYSLRDLLTVGLPALALLVGGFWLAAQFVKPAPPDYLYLSSGGPGGSYEVYAERYRQILAKNGVDLREQPSAGAIENIKRLLDKDDETEAALVQSGTANGANVEDLYSLGFLYNEPLWVFYRSGRTLDSLAQLRGRRIAVGAEGSGTRKLALQLLETSGIDKKTAHLLPLGGLAAAQALQNREVDAVFLVGSERSAAVWTLFYTQDVRLMSLAEAEAYARLFPYLTQLTLPQGVIDMARNIPAHDVKLVSPMAMLAVHQSLHPALVQLLLQAAQEVHAEAGIFQRPGEFPRAGRADFPMSPEADRFYKSGKPFLQRYLPFWAADLIDRTVIMLVPVLALLIPILRFAPPLYIWRVRSRIFRYYGELKFLEAELEADPLRYSRTEWLEKIDRIESDAHHIPTPLAFTDTLYTLRLHLDLVRTAILKKTTHPDQVKPT